MGLMVFLLWMRLIFSILGAGQFPSQFAGMVALQTQALDLGLVVPLMISTAILLWRRSSWGYLLAGVSVSFGLMMYIVLPAWIAVPLLRQGRIDLVEAVPFLAGSGVGLVLAWMFFRNVSALICRNLNVAPPPCHDEGLVLYDPPTGYLQRQ